MKRKWIGALVLALTAMLFASTALAVPKTCDGKHSFRPWRIKTSATCTRQGHEFRYCRNCDHWEQRYTKKLPHTPGEWTITREPTCTQEGVQETICQVCHNVVRQRIDKLPHTYGEMAVEGADLHAKRQGRICLRGLRREEGRNAFKAGT